MRPVKHVTTHKFYISCPDRQGCASEMAVGFGDSEDEARENAFAMVWQHLRDEHGAVPIDRSSADRKEAR